MIMPRYPAIKSLSQSALLTSCQSIVQPAYRDNWYAQPTYYSSADYSVSYSAAQAKTNIKNYADRAFPVYTEGPNHGTDMDPFEDWKAGDPDPEWTPIAGGAMGDQVA